MLELGGATIPADLDGRSLVAVLGDESASVRDDLLIEYYSDQVFPRLQNMGYKAIRTDRYKYVFYHGLWDHNGFYDLETDPIERHNLIQVPGYRDRIEAMKAQLFGELEASGGLVLPVRPPAGERLDQRKLRR